MIRRLKNIPLCSRWLREATGTAIAEFALIFPILFALMIGTFELGYGIVASQKTIAASQIVADLITREISLSEDQIDEAIQAGRLAIQPFNTDGYGVDIVSVQFDEQDSPVQVWRETRNMNPSGNLIDLTNGLGTDGEGAVAVMVSYDYTSQFGSFFINDIALREISFARGRKSAVVSRDIDAEDE